MPACRAVTQERGPLTRTIHISGRVRPLSLSFHIVIQVHFNNHFHSFQVHFITLYSHLTHFHNPLEEVVQFQNGSFTIKHGSFISKWNVQSKT